MSRDYRWKFVRIGIDKFALYRDGLFMFSRTSTEIQRDRRFRNRSALLVELDKDGVAAIEIPRLSISVGF